MEIVTSLFWLCSNEVRYALVKADLIPQLLITLNPQSFSFTDAEDIHINLMNSINHSLWLATPRRLAKLGIEDNNEEQAVHKTILKQVVTPSETCICHLCVSRLSIIDGKQSDSS
ncbi:hypothetical protein BLNAU_12474 [Blattamonas nauphoetae]|uniref:Uncharacterized protein n=1 Tax=Blattamonas nauphoetae TaxID=2049346 RepID=A0ABQ9XQS5_9EUKA|nr:hypothetical protein BLNAU_12474 [Blattamonas nauphoetae]